MKKNYSLRIFNILAKRVYRLSKKRKLNWTWRDAQRWTSVNMFQRYKGSPLGKLKLTEIDQNALSILEGRTTPVQFPLSTSKTKGKQEPENCYSPFLIPSEYLDSIEWWLLDDAFSKFNDDLLVEFDLETEGIVFKQTGIMKKGAVGSLVDVREDMRKLFGMTSPPPMIIFTIVVREGRPDDGKACSYNVLISFEDSMAYINAISRMKRVFVPMSALPISDKLRIEEEKRLREEERKNAITKKSIKNAQRPKVVEEIPEKKETEKQKVDKLKQYNKAIKELKKMYNDGLISKKQFRKRFDDLGKNLKSGGEV